MYKLLHWLIYGYAPCQHKYVIERAWNGTNKIVYVSRCEHCGNIKITTF